MGLNTIGKFENYELSVILPARNGEELTRSMIVDITNHFKKKHIDRIVNLLSRLVFNVHLTLEEQQ